MLKIFGAILLASVIGSAAAYAHGGGPAESMPLTNYTDMPDYRPRPLVPCARSKHACSRVRWHQGVSRSN